MEDILLELNSTFQYVNCEEQAKSISKLEIELETIREKKKSLVEKQDFENVAEMRLQERELEAKLKKSKIGERVINEYEWYVYLLEKSDDFCEGTIVIGKENDIEDILYYDEYEYLVKENYRHD